LAELQMRRGKLLDNRGLHPYSVEVGRIFALEDLEPSLANLGFNPVVLRLEAQREASRIFEIETAIKVARQYGWLSQAEEEAILRESNDEQQRTWITSRERSSRE
jgi:hypothetical protein